MTNKTIFEEALDFHKNGKPGKVALQLTKPLETQHDLAMAYSPGVAECCTEISKDYDKIYDYTAKGNYIAIISNGTAILGLGDLGAGASKPVMEGKCALFKKFGKIDAVDIEVGTKDVEEFINCVKLLGDTWGGINLEDIKAPECFEIETRLKELMSIPVFHDDQHGTAVISGAGLLNALKINGKKIEDIKVVFNGAGAASISCAKLVEALGVKHENIIMCDSKGVIYKGRTAGMNKWKEMMAKETELRTLAEALNGADVFFGLSVADALKPEMLKTMAKDPIVFALANPNPEITWELANSTRSDVIMATGRSDYPNQINNVMGFPYIFRGTLDTRATQINEEMKLAATYALAELATKEVPEEVKKIYGKDLKFGKEYIVPTPFDPRLYVEVSMAVAKAAVKSGVAKKKITDWEAYKKELLARE